MNKTISILIADFEIENLREILEYHTEWKIRETKNTKKILTEVLEIHIIELPKTVYKVEDEEIDESSNKLKKWIKFLVNPMKIEEKEMKNTKIKEAKEEYKGVISEEKAQYIAELREKYYLEMNAKYSDGYDKGIEEGQEKIKESYKEGYEKGEEKGKIEGIEEYRIKIVKNLKNKNYDLKDIEEITGLTKEEIEKIK